MTKKKDFRTPPRSLTRDFPQVERVIFADKSVKVDVHPRDCKEGKKFQTSECALAKAAKRQFHADGVAIRLTDSFIIKGKTAIRFKTPESVKRELVSFDRHQDFAAGTYQLSRIPQDWRLPKVKREDITSGSRKEQPNKTHRTVRVRTVNSGERESN